MKKIFKEAFSKAIKVFWNVFAPALLALLIHDLLILSIAEITFTFTRGGN
jgi:hypothetical protein